MNHKQIHQLRSAIRFTTVIWSPDHHTRAVITAVSTQPQDPDKTGTADYIAQLEYGGNIDLSNVDPADIKIVTPLFPQQPTLH